jgi:hypothetical protein
MTAVAAARMIARAGRSKCVVTTTKNPRVVTLLPHRPFSSAVVEPPVIPGVGKGKTSTGLVRISFIVFLCFCEREAKISNKQLGEFTDLDIGWLGRRTRLVQQNEHQIPGPFNQIGRIRHARNSAIPY